MAPAKVPATAKWAKRILRPLTSIHRRLKKHNQVQPFPSPEQNEETDDDFFLESDVPTDDARAGSNPGSDADDADPKWIPGKKISKRRLKHKFSNRGGNPRKRTLVSAQSPQTNSTLPGAIELATPLITGTIMQAPTNLQAQNPIQQPNFGNVQESSHTKRPGQAWQQFLDDIGDPDFKNIMQNFDRTLKDFLENTRVPRHDRGARSLLSMTLRHLPRVIAEAQEELNETVAVEEQNKDLCDECYTDLENHYACGKPAWEPLREAVRAQGIWTISDLIRKKWIKEPVACALIQTCQNRDPEIFEELLSLVLSKTRTVWNYPRWTKLPSPSFTDPIGLLHKYGACVSNKPNHSYVFDELTKLLVSGTMTPEWMATNVWVDWMKKAVITSSVQDDDFHAACQLIRTVLYLASDVQRAAKPIRHPPRPLARDLGPPRARRAAYTVNDWVPPGVREDEPCPVRVTEALSNQCTSVLAAFCGMHISRSRAPGSEARNDQGVIKTAAGDFISRLCSEANSELNSRSSTTEGFTKHQLIRRGCILLADCLVKCNDAILARDEELILAAAPEVEELSGNLSAPELVKDMSSFVRRSLRYFGGATLGSGQATSDQAPPERRLEDQSLEERDPYLQWLKNLERSRETRRMISRLAHLADAAHTPKFFTLVTKVAVEAAMQFAEETHDQDDHDWAIEVQEAVIELQRQKDTNLDTTNDSFRYEESIGEWVARTPATKQNAGPKVIIRGRRSMAAMPPCSSNSSSPESESSANPSRSQTPSSSPTTPSQTGKERRVEAVDDSPIRPAKRMMTRSNTSLNSLIMPSSSRRKRSAEEAESSATRPAKRPRPMSSMYGGRVEVVIINHQQSTAPPRGVIGEDIEEEESDDELSFL
ncbi:hypothetical protein N7532_003985 [Penicillium argentinense]|uniref:Uncharacterized protein n=1 Tax=Penicillium argentinense TaxID=1131581 RepID=A0A9W9KF23_9EURO|nr:uncharacterized protein N7532_003985 [Penicillium argentinense]KAJ5103456.1 hypothetical protein N7532_003985 [Penicillium argentinense]